MSTESVNPVESAVDTTDLDSFADEFFGQSEPAPEPASSEESNEEVVEPENSDAPSETEDTEETQETSEEEDADEPEEEVKPKAKPKNRAQERISELNTKWREEQRKREALEAQLAEIQTPKNTTPKPAPAVLDSSALNEDGTPKYPMGDFDPNYIRDLAEATVAARLEQERKVQEEAKAQAAEQIQQNALIESWNEKLTPALDRYPDFQEKAEELLTSLTGLDSDYEDYIAATIMQLDYGPDVLYYLSENPSEAQAIVNAGPTKAAVALGRLEAKFALTEAEKTIARPKVSKAPDPPPTNRGVAVVKGSVAPDTDDLEAFERALFNKKK